jgi:energy-coupling factor transport system permease protein
MNEFDFLSRITLGQYFPTDSVIHRRDPRVKIAGFTLLIIFITFSISKIGLAVAIIALLVGVLFSKVKLSFALKGLLPPLPWLLIIAVIQVFFITGTTGTPALLTLGKLNITMVGVWSGIMLLVRFTALILCISLASFTISTSEMIQGLGLLLKPLNKLGIHTSDLVMVVQVMLRFIPFLAQTAERIAKAQASRGGNWSNKTRNVITRIRQVVPLLIPLFVISLRRAENMALAMDARAYGYLPQRTSYHEFKLRRSDVLFLLICATISLAIFSV